MNRLEIKIIQTKDKNIRFDFFIDDIQLSKSLGFDRLTDMSFSDFDLDIFEVNKEKFPSYNRLEIVKQSVKIFLGLQKPYNQFGTERVVLYRCHCGCDYCGVISFNIKVNNGYVYWYDLRIESEDENNKYETIKTINELKFNRKDYENVFNEFSKRYCS